jgi:hypothetical protein
MGYEESSVRNHGKKPFYPGLLAKLLMSLMMHKLPGICEGFFKEQILPAYN